ncbi:MAG: UDP-N-acetylmuramate dehydrogenase [Caldiserica bacterium]|jgi:UDP-N-acetylmuramate dehydrogenase|nr:UDP-N-acetylmuramate dehydrogenase [Caldisericota bacterium]MDH7562988.1 UDP-N-acetylmuramate dehydrogenase [Caldisericota bacterium]
MKLMREKVLEKTGFKGPVFYREPMSRHTSYKIGGPARIFCLPQDVEDLKKALIFSHEEGIPYYIIGNGTNLLVSDEGFEGMVIKISGVFNGFQFSGEKVIAGAGTDLCHLINQAGKQGLFGWPFAVGIPGTVAGAVVMNAGSSTLHMGQHVQKVWALDCKSLEFVEMRNDDLQFQYRKSILDSGKWVVLEVELLLQREDPDKIFLRIEDLLQRRRKVQPLNYPSAGSVFRNPDNAFAGKLIEDAGCKGWTQGGAMVSPVHANFIVNFNHARAIDVGTLMARVRKEVEEKFGISLEPELKIIGNWPEELEEFLRPYKG